MEDTNATGQSHGRRGPQCIFDAALTTDATTDQSIAAAGKNATGQAHGSEAKSAASSRHAEPTNAATATSGQASTSATGQTPQPGACGGPLADSNEVSYEANQPPAFQPYGHNAASVVTVSSFAVS